MWLGGWWLCVVWSGSVVGCTVSLCAGVAHPVNVAMWGVSAGAVSISSSGAVTVDLFGLFELLSGRVLNKTQLEVWGSDQSTDWDMGGLWLGSMMTDPNGNVHQTYQTTGLLHAGPTFQGRFQINQPGNRTQFVAGPSVNTPATPVPVTPTSKHHFSTTHYPSTNSHRYGYYVSGIVHVSVHVCVVYYISSMICACV